jgi:hypothetical protein
VVGKFESNKDMVQEIAESAATHVGKIATIIAGAVRDVTREIGDFVTDGIEMREAAKAARDDDEPLTNAPGEFLTDAPARDHDSPTAE